MDIKGSEYFIPASRIPVLSHEDTVSDAVDAMKRKGVRVAVMVRGDMRWEIWMDEISQYCAEKGPVVPWMVSLRSIVGDAPATDAIDRTAEPHELDALLGSERAVMVTDGGELAGVATRDGQALWPPAVSECIQGHLFFPPVPKRCPYDGTSIE